MDAAALITDLASRGIRLVPKPPKLQIRATALTDADRAIIRAHKAQLLQLLTSRPLVGDRWLDAARRGREADEREHEIDRLARADGWTPATEIPSAIVAEIGRIEGQALALGWQPARLWHFKFWPHTQSEPRGLASVMDEGDRIIEVFADYLVIEKSNGRGERQRFWRCQ